MDKKHQEFEDLKAELRSILTSSKHGCTEAELQKDYSNFNGNKPIPYTDFGFATLLEMLKAMSDVARIDYFSNPPKIHAVAHEKTQHILQMVRHQASTGSKNRTRFRAPRPNLNTQNKFIPAARQVGYPMVPIYRPRFGPPRPLISDSKIPVGSSWKVNEPLTTMESIPRQETSHRNIADITVMDLNKNDREKALKYGEQAIKVRKNIRLLLLQFSSKIMLGNLDQLYQTTFSQPLDRSALKIQDQSDFSDFVSDFADVSCTDSKQPEKSLLIVKEHCTNAMKLERQQDSVTSNKMVDESSNVIAPRIETPRFDQNYNNPDRSPLEGSIAANSSDSRFVPADFVYRRLDLMDDQPFLASIVDFKTVVMLSIVPMDFVNKREKMMRDLKNHYERSADASYIIPGSKLRIKLPCVYYDAKDDRYYRAYVDSIEKSGSVKVSLFLVDYCELIEKIEIDTKSPDILYLHQDFGSLPTQFCDCCLSNIDIVHDDDLANEAYTFVYDLCIEPPVVVEVVGYFESGCCIRLWAKNCETSINDKLVERGFATIHDDCSLEEWRPTQQNLENQIEQNAIYARAFAQDSQANVSLQKHIKKYRVSADQEFDFIRSPFNSWACLPCFQLARLLRIDEPILLLLNIMRRVKFDFSADVAPIFCHLYSLTESNQCNHLKCPTRQSHIVLYDLESIVEYLSTENFTDGDILDAFKTEFIRSKTDEYWNEENDSYNPSHDKQLKHRIEQERLQQSTRVSPRLPYMTNPLYVDQLSNNSLIYEENQRLQYDRISRKSKLAREKMRQTLLRIASPFDRDFGLSTIEDLNERFRDLQRITKNVACFFRIEREMIDENDKMILDSAEAGLDEMTESSSMEQRVEVYNYCLSIVRCLEPHIRSYVKQTDILGIL